MANNADGSIIIDTKIDRTGAEAGSDELVASVRRMASSVRGLGREAQISLKKQVDAFARMNAQYNEQAKKVAKLREELKAFDSQQVETDEFRGLEKTLKSLEEQFDTTEQKQREWLNLGFPVDSAPLKEIEKELDEIYAKMQKVQERQTNMKSSGTAYKKPEELKGYGTTASKLQVEERRLADMQTRIGTSYDSISAKADKYKDSVRGLTITNSGLHKNISRLSAGLKKAATMMLGLNKQAKQTKMTMGRMLGMSLLFSIVFRALSAVMGGIKEGFQNLAQYSGVTNNAISSLMSALTRLKNSFATAFAPILEVVAPILVSFINIISRAVTYVGMFFASLTGQSSFVKAVGVQEDYAAELKDTADQAQNAEKALKKYLNPLDEINRYETDVSGSSAGVKPGYTGPDPSEMFETVPIENSIKGLADKIRNLIKAEDWDGLGEYIASGINKGLQKIKDAISWDNVGPQITYFANAFTKTLNSLADNINWDLLGSTIGEGVNTIVKMLNLLVEGIDWKRLGKSFANGINGLVRTVNWKEFGNLLGSKFMIAWNMLYGFVTNLKWGDIGTAIGKALNGAIEKIDGTTIGKAVSNLIIGLLDMITKAVKTADWKAVGVEIGNMLKAIDWVGIGNGLFKAGLAIIQGLLSAFGELPLPVQLAAAAITAFFTALKGYTIIKLIIDAINGAGGLISALSGLVGFLTNPVVLAITAVVAAGILIIANWEEISAAASDLWGKITDTLSRFWERIKKNASELWNSISNVISKVWDGLKKTASKVFDTIKTTISKVWDKVKKNASDLWNSISNVVSKAWDGIKTTATKVFNAVGTGIANVWSNIKKNTSEIWNGITNTISKVWNGLKSTATNVFNGIKNGISTAWNNVKSATSSIWNGIKSNLSSIWNGIKSGASNIFNGIKNAITTAWNNTKSSTSSLWEGIKSGLTTTWSRLSSSASSTFEGMKSVITNAWNSLKSISTSIWNGISGAVSSVWANMGGAASRAGNIIKNAFSGAFRALVSLIKAPVNSVIGLINGLVRGVVSGINFILKGFNLLSVHIPSWVPGIGGKTLGFNFSYITAPQIPYLATGAVIPPNAPFAAVLGDQKHGTNIETPEALLRKIVREESGNKGLGGKYQFTAVINRRTIFDELIEEAKLRQSASGMNPFELV